MSAGSRRSRPSSCPPREVDAAELIAFSRERLASHKVPKSVHFVDELPKNASASFSSVSCAWPSGGSASAVGSAGGVASQ